MASVKSLNEVRRLQKTFEGLDFVPTLEERKSGRICPRFRKFVSVYTCAQCKDFVFFDSRIEINIFKKHGYCSLLEKKGKEIWDA